LLNYSVCFKHKLVLFSLFFQSSQHSLVLHYIEVLQIKQLVYRPQKLAALYGSVFTLRIE